MELKDLVGEHVLDAVDKWDERVRDEQAYIDDDCQMVRFRLDGICYLVVEDPEDGYRSAMKDISVTNIVPKNVFPPQKVVCSHRTKGEFDGLDDILEIRLAANGKIILEVGTVDLDDYYYYPCFRDNYYPENFE